MRTILRLFALVGSIALTGCAGLIPGMGLSSSLEYRQAMQAQREREAATPTESGDKDADSQLEQGDHELAQGQRRRALLHYLEARRENPTDPMPLIRIGYYYLTEDPEQSAAIFASVISRDDESAAAHAGLGLARFSQGRSEEARLSFERAIEIDANFPAALDALGILHAMENDRETGLAYAKKAFNANPRDPHIANNLGVAFLHESEFTLAEETFRGAILLDPSDPALYNNLGFALGRQGRLDEATAAFRRFGNDSAVYNNLGYVHYLNGDKKNAIRYFEIALRTADEHERIRVLQNLRAATKHPAAVSP